MTLEKRSARAETGPVMRQNDEGFKNLTQKFEQLYYAASVITAPSRFDRTAENPEGRERPLFVRAHRADLYRQQRGQPREEKQKVFDEAHMRDDITRQYLDQRDLTIHSNEYGDIGARMVDIVPLQSLEKEGLPPVIIIPGISSDIECVNNMACEAAMLGRRVIVVAQPDSIKGHITPAFVEAAQKDKGYGPHVAFFAEALRHIFKNNEPYELWGYSTGAVIIAELLNQPEFQQRALNAALICPAGFVEQSKTSLNMGLAWEIGILKNSSSVYAAMGHGFEKTEQLKLQDEIMGALIQKLLHADSDWKTARVHEGGKIVVVNGELDNVTKSYTISDEYTQNPQMRVLNLSGGYHATPLLEAETIIPQIFEKQK